MNNTDMSQLHDRFTRGEVLTETELSILYAWYDQQDVEENARINQTSNGSDTARQLQQQITQTALQLQTVTQQITAIIVTNEALRGEIHALQARLAQQAPGRAA